MDSDLKGSAVVIMGVSGCGKSTIGGMLAKAISCTFLDADDFHSKENKEKMSKGIPLSEEDRIPWLQTLRDAIRESIVNGKTVVLSCSALQRKYREILRTADPAYEMVLDNRNCIPELKSTCRVKFVFLQAPIEVIADRLEKRAADGEHFMPATLLQSQLDLLQIDDSEGIITVNAELSPDAIVANIQSQIFYKKKASFTNDVEQFLEILSQGRSQAWQVKEV